MPIHTHIVQRFTGGHGCDMCSLCDPNNIYYTYTGRSRIEAHEPNHLIRVLRWTESEYRMCDQCNFYIQSNNVLALDHRIARLNPRLKPRVIAGRLDEFFGHKRFAARVVGAHAR